MSVKQNGPVLEMEGPMACVDGSINPLKMFFNDQTLELTNGEAGDVPYKCGLLK